MLILNSTDTQRENSMKYDDYIYRLTMRLLAGAVGVPTELAPLDGAISLNQGKEIVASIRAFSS
jgi:hypothetical protein